MLRVQNAAARLIFKQPKFSHITPVLCQLHWVPIKYRIKFKILLFTFKAIHSMAPDYICKLISRKSPTRYSLRFSQIIFLEIPSGLRAFCYAAPKLWKICPVKYLALTHSQGLRAPQNISISKLLICKCYIFYFVKYLLFTL